MSKRCAAFIKSGDRCKNRAAIEAQYCWLHEEKYAEIEGFFSNNKEHLVGFLAGLLTETIIDDGYEQIKQLLRPVPAAPQTVRSFEITLNSLNEILRNVTIENRRHWIKYLPINSRVGKYGIYECRFPNAPEDRGASGNGPISIYIVDKDGRRFVGDSAGADVRIEFIDSIEYLVAHYHMNASGGTDRFYRISGESGNEKLTLMFTDRQGQERDWHIPSN